MSKYKVQLNQNRLRSKINQIEDENKPIRKSSKNQGTWNRKCKKKSSANRARPLIGSVRWPIGSLGLRSASFFFFLGGGPSYSFLFQGGVENKINICQTRITFLFTLSLSLSLSLSFSFFLRSFFLSSVSLRISERKSNQILKKIRPLFLSLHSVPHFPGLSAPRVKGIEKKTNRKRQRKRKEKKWNE